MIRLRWRRRTSSGGIRTWASLPKPVLIPYTVVPLATTRSTTARDTASRLRAPASAVAGRSPRATATTSSIVRDLPSRITGEDMREKIEPWDTENRKRRRDRGASSTRREGKGEFCPRPLLPLPIRYGCLGITPLLLAAR